MNNEASGDSEMGTTLNIKDSSQGAKQESFIVDSPRKRLVCDVPAILTSLKNNYSVCWDLEAVTQPPISLPKTAFVPLTWWSRHKYKRKGLEKIYRFRMLMQQAPVRSSATGIGTNKFFGNGIQPTATQRDFFERWNIWGRAYLFLIRKLKIPLGCIDAKQFRPPKTDEMAEG
jgi:hypothetical protein